MPIQTDNPPLSRKQQQHGFSLIELLVGMTIALILMAGLVSIVINTNQNYAELNKASRQLENGRYAVQLLKDSIQHAGFYGKYSNADSLTLPATLTDVNPCDTSPDDLDDALPLSLQGYNATVTTLGCLADANHLDGTDVLVVRRASTNTTNLDDLLGEGRVYLQSRADNFVLATAGDPAAFNLTKKDGVTAADIREYRVEIYFVSSCNECTVSDDIPTLKRLILSGNVIVTEPLAEGIENFQVEYGIDRSVNGIPNESAGGEDAAYVAEPANTTDWSNVMSVRLHVLARNTKQSPGYTDNKSYNLGLAGTVTAPGDAFKRHLFSSAIRLINPAGRRES